MIYDRIIILFHLKLRFLGKSFYSSLSHRYYSYSVAQKFIFRKIKEQVKNIVIFSEIRFLILLRKSIHLFTVMCSKRKRFIGRCVKIKKTKQQQKCLMQFFYCTRYREKF